MTEKFFPEQLFEAGFTDLVSIIPPGAQLTPSSKIAPSAVGKVPGRRLANGLWAGYDWRTHRPTRDDVHQWALDGANIGLRAGRFPAVDIDTLDERIAAIIEEAARTKLGAAPVRVGRAPKRLLMYRTAEPFGRMRLWLNQKDTSHLVEVLGEGQQYLIHGTHPQTLLPYAWDRDLVALGPEGLTCITREQVDAFLTYLGELLDMLSLGTIEREGDGKAPSSAEFVDQDGLRAPSVDLVRQAVAMIPNTTALFPTRNDYITMGYAIRAAVGEENEPEGFHIYAEWAEQWEGNDRNPKGNDPEIVREDWKRMTRKRKVGWPWIAEKARAFGFRDALLDFTALDEAPRDTPPEAPLYSDQWLAEKIAAARRGELRFVPQRGTWLVWDSARWKVDADLLAEDIVKRELCVIGADLMRHGATPKEQREFERLAVNVCSAGKAAAVRGLMQSDRAIAVPIEALDHDPWVLNTPAGIIDLRTGKLSPPDPDALCTHSTAVPADFGGACPEWRRFLAEATGGDRELEAYMQRLAGYCLTGSVREQQLTFIWGGGQNGKSVFLNALVGIMGDYAQVATMDTFTASTSDRHTTDIAMLVGSRLVSASETRAGKRWDDQRVKSLTGGERITARFMRQDNFTYEPQFKLVFIGNHKPEIRDMDTAMRRRIHLVPFTVRPAVIDPELGNKLRAEWPAILAWMVEGCLAWQREGLNPPARVRDATAEYFADEDAVGRWLAECTEPAEENCTTMELFASWQEWANANGEYVGSVKRLSSALQARSYARWRDPKTRRMGFSGLRILDRQFDEIR